MTDAVAEPQPQPEKVNPLQRIGGVLFSPSETFESIARRPDWVVPLLVLIIVSIVSAWLIASHVDADDLARQAMEQNPKFSTFPVEQQNRMLSFTASMFRAMRYIGPTLSIVLLLVVAGALLLGVRAMGGKGNFLQAFSVAIYGWYPRLIKGIIAVIVLMNKKSLSMFTLQDPLRSSLGFLVDPKAKPVMFALLSSFDIFTFWSLALYVIGYSAISRLSRGKTAAVVITLWLVVVLLSLIGPAMQGLRK